MDLNFILFHHPDEISATEISLGRQRSLKTQRKKYVFVALISSGVANIGERLINFKSIFEALTHLCI
jgi:hypothetical protein